MEWVTVSHIAPPQLTMPYQIYFKFSHKIKSLVILYINQTGAPGITVKKKKLLSNNPHFLLQIKSAQQL